MPAVGETLRVEGLSELQQAFKLADAALAKELRTSLRQLAEPVRSDAERLAVVGIPTIGLPWSRMRVGVTKHSVYVAPRQRGVRARFDRRRRPEFAELLLDRSLLPALQRNVPNTMSGFDDILREVGKEWERA